MQSRLKVFLLSLALSALSYQLLAVSFSTVAYADPVPLIIDVRDDLKLTDNQVSEISAIWKQQFRQRRLASARIILIDDELEDLTEKEADPAQIEKRLREKADIQTNLRVGEIATERKVNRLLSPEQLKRWRAIHASVTGRR